MKRSPAQRAAMSHNSLIGLAVCIQRHAGTVLQGQTVNGKALSYANAIKQAAELLEAELRKGAN